MSRLLRSLSTVAIWTAILTGCATSPKASIEAGDARLIDGTVSVDLFKVKALVALKDQRASVWMYITDCRQGNGTLWVDDGSYSEAVNNVIARASRPADQLFALICREGLPIAQRDEEARERRRAAMTPEEREAERRMIFQLLLLQQSQQAESARNASRERAARAISDALKDSKKSTTDCTATSPLTVRCETK